MKQSLLMSTGITEKNHPGILVKTQVSEPSQIFDSESETQEFEFLLITPSGNANLRPIL